MERFYVFERTKTYDITKELWVTHMYYNPLFPNDYWLFNQMPLTYLQGRQFANSKRDEQ